MVKPVYIVWEGQQPVAQVRFELEPTPFQLPSHLIEERERIWRFLTHFDPNQYNGSLFLAHISPYYSVPFPSIRVQPISYRHFKTLQYAHRGFPPVGTDYATVDDPSRFTRSGPDEVDFRHDIFQEQSALCSVYLVTNPSRSHVLVGQRQEIGGWGDGFLACPGGMIEWSGLPQVQQAVDDSSGFSAGIIRKLLLSELEEEVAADLATGAMAVRGLIDARNGMFANMVLEVNIASCDLNELVRTNHEFVDRQLRWKAIAEIKQLPDDRLFGGLRFLKHSSLF